MIPVFVDTAAWIALSNFRDALHLRAQSVYTKLVQRKVPLVTSDFVLLEVADALGTPALRSHTIWFIDRLLLLHDRIVGLTNWHFTQCF